MSNKVKECENHLRDILIQELQRRRTSPWDNCSVEKLELQLKWFIENIQRAISRSEKEIRSLGVFHQDSRPENILWNPDLKRALIIDFHRCTFDHRPIRRRSRSLNRLLSGTKEWEVKRVRVVWVSGRHKIVLHHCWPYHNSDEMQAWNGRKPCLCQSLPSLVSFRHCLLSGPLWDYLGKTFPCSHIGFSLPLSKWTIKVKSIRHHSACKSWSRQASGEHWPPTNSLRFSHLMTFASLWNQWMNQMSKSTWPLSVCSWSYKTASMFYFPKWWIIGQWNPM